MAKKLITKALEFYDRHDRSLPAIFFASGVSFDIITLGRIDDIFNLVQQAAFLLAVGFIIALEVRHSYNPERIPKWIGKYFEFRELAVHFLFGALLSAYSIFYFKSSSSFTLLFFFVPLCVLMVANEVPRFQQLGIPLHMALLSLCLISYFTYLLPILFGSISDLFFLLAWIISGTCIFLFIKRFWKKVAKPQLIKQLILPTALIHLLFFGLYFAQLIPPVPIAVDHMGIYHHVEKLDNRYKLAYTRPAWKFWQNGDQDFDAAVGDRVYCYFRIFSPTAFEDKVHLRWAFRNKREQWESADAIPVRIVGGRAQGFRGYTYKQNYHPGDWRVTVETLDGREIGRLNFDVREIAEAGSRRLRVTYD